MESSIKNIKPSKLLSRIVFISDTHMRKGLTDLTDYGDSFFYKAIDDIKSLNMEIDAIINLGDLSESGMDRDNISLTNYYDYIKTNPLKNKNNCAIPFYGILGNHDCRGDSTIEHLPSERQEDFLKASKVYQQNEIYSNWKESTYIHGSYSEHQESPDLNFYIDIKGFHYIFLNTCESQWDVCHLTKANLDWLDNTLTNLEKIDKNKPIFVLIHQPIDKINDSIYLLNADGTRSNNIYAFHEILAKHKTSICCSGHTHSPLGVNHIFQNKNFNGIIVPNYINMPSLEYNNYPDFYAVGVNDYKIKKTSSYSNIQYYICEIFDNKIIFKARDGFYKKWIRKSNMIIYYENS